MVQIFDEDYVSTLSESFQSFSVLGLSHKTASLEIREKLVWNEEELDNLYKRLSAEPGIKGILILSTCNRSEIYTTAEDIARTQDIVRNEFMNRLGDKGSNDFFYCHSGQRAIEHLVSVTSGLDSMILGEPQIAGQVKESYARAVKKGMSDTILNQITHRSFRIAKKIRTETDIQKQPVSVPYTAVLLAEQIFGDLSSKRVLLIGAGQMCELAARHLLEHRLEGLMIANRSAEKAQELTKQFLGDVACEVLSLESMMSRLHAADIIIASTSSHETLIQEENVREAMRQRKNRSMFFIDLGVPRDIDPCVNNIMNVFLFDIDDLQKVVDDNLDERQKAASEADKIIREEVGLLDTYLAERDMTPVIRELVDQFNLIRRGEMEKLYRKLPDLNGNERDVIEQYTEGMMKKVLHPTLHWLKEAPKEGDPREKIDLIRSLFRLK